MDPKIELLGRLSDALTRGQGGFTEEDLSLAFEEVYGMLIQSELWGLIVEGKLNLRISDGTVLYAAETGGEEPVEAVPLEMLVKNVRGAEGQ